MSFVGRAPELQALHALLETARERRATVALIEGPPGIGKTSLVARFVESVDGVRIVSVSGDESEVLLSLGVVDQLFRSAGEREPGLIAFDGAMADPFAAGLRILDLIGQLQSEGPAILVVDDAHWADESSLRALLFACKRMVDDSVLVVLVVREGEADKLPSGLRKLAAATISVQALPAPYIGELARAAGVSLSLRAAERLRDHTDGNPLHASALLREVPPDALEDPADPLPAPRSYSALVVRNARRVPSSALRLTQAAAVLGMRSRLGDAASLAKLDQPLRALEDAVRAGLLVTDSRRELITFPHPLVRAAIYHDLGPASRTRLHAGAARRITEPTLALRHRVAAASTADAPLAAELEAQAQVESQRGAGPAAAALLMDASRLSEDEDERNRRLLKAVDAMLYVGHTAEASRHLDTVSAMPAGPLRDMVLAHAAIVRGDPAAGQELLDSAWQQCDVRDDPPLAAAIARRSAYYWMGELRAAETVAWGRRGMQLAPPGGAEAMESAGQHAFGLALSGEFAAAKEAADHAVERLNQSGTGDGLLVRPLRGWVKLLNDDVGGALADLSTFAPAALRVGSTITAAAAYAWLAEAEYLAGHWDDSIVHADRAVSIGTGEEWLASRGAALANAAWVRLERGDLETATATIGLLGEHVATSRFDVANLAIARAQLAANRREPETVRETLEPLARAPAGSGIREPAGFRMDQLYVEALIELQRHDEADAFLAEVEPLVAARNHVSAMGRMARVRGRLESARGRPRAANAAFVAAIERGVAVGMPYELATTRLAYGQFLRGQGRTRAAVTQLTQARTCFVELSALPAFERCERELVASGRRPSSRTVRGRGRLTPQEQVVARLAASGMTNRQIAAELIVSAKTVEVHLTRIYAKLGMSSRAELADHYA